MIFSFKVCLMQSWSLYTTFRSPIGQGSVFALVTTASKLLAPGPEILKGLAGKLSEKVHFVGSSLHVIARCVLGYKHPKVRLGWMCRDAIHPAKLVTGCPWVFRVHYDISSLRNSQDSYMAAGLQHRTHWVIKPGK